MFVAAGALEYWSNGVLGKIVQVDFLHGRTKLIAWLFEKA